MDLKTQRNLAVVAAVAAVVILAAALIISSIRIHNVGRIKAVGVKVYWDLECTDEITKIDWETLNPGDLAGVTTYIKNVKNTAVTMNFTTEVWNPPGTEQYLTFDWNYTKGTVLEPTAVIIVQMTLYVDPTIEGVDQFSFDIVIMATEYAP